MRFKPSAWKFFFGGDTGGACDFMIFFLIRIYYLRIMPRQAIIDSPGARHHLIFKGNVLKSARE